MPIRKLLFSVPVVRSYLVLLLLVNYLLVVGAGLVERPAQVVNRPFNYVHRPDCQLKHQLRLACFDDCNGVQYTVKKPGEKLPLHQLLTTFKGLDAHCLPEWEVFFAAPMSPQAGVQHTPFTSVVASGYRGRVELPPCRG
jgi:hypothetical protein